MNNLIALRIRFIGVTLILAGWASHANAQILNPAELAGLHGGLIVQLGASDTQVAADLSLSGRYLIHVLDPDAGLIQAARTRLRKDGRYGLTWAEQARDRVRLPYTENVVNLIVIRDYSVPIKELSRVLAPGGMVVVTNAEVLKRSQLEAGGFDSFSKVDLKINREKAVAGGDGCLVSSSTRR